MSVPGPIKVPLTAKEAAAAHLCIESLLQVVRDEPARYPTINVSLLARVTGAIERELKKVGCVLDEDGWRA